jgi:hypothetical protein
MYRNAKAAMVKVGLILEDLSSNLGGTVSTWSLKLNGKAPITLNEAKAFKRLVNSDKPLEELFEEYEEAT